MPARPFMHPGACDPEAVAAMSEAVEGAVKELQDAGQTNVAREAIAGRIIAAAKFGERDPVRLGQPRLPGCQARKTSRAFAVQGAPRRSVRRRPARPLAWQSRTPQNRGHRGS